MKDGWTGHAERMMLEVIAYEEQRDLNLLDLSNISQILLPK